MNANQSPDSPQSHRKHGASGESPAGSTVVFKRSFNVGKLSEQDRASARELLQRLMASGAVRRQSAGPGML